MRVLGLETSCDETAAAVVETGEGLRGSVLSDVVHTQKDVHEKWGGVVPELASRDHLQRVLPVLDEALRKAGCELRGLDGSAVTRGAGPARRSASRAAASGPSGAAAEGRVEGHPVKGGPPSQLRSGRRCATRGGSGRCARRDVLACGRWGSAAVWRRARGWGSWRRS